MDHNIDYFKLRNVSFENYANFKLPKWIEQEITSKDLFILDYGCGLGQLLNALRDFGCKNIYGVDIDDKAIAFCKKKGLAVEKVNQENLLNPFHFKFDVVIMSHVLEHIPKDQIISTLTCIKDRFLKGGGVKS